ncbi:protein MANBAL [Phasianus colchicus]|uniref:protein MANBAL n=1 Tax=Phasianus colchicus TaxID=9054 RepID=UPI00129E5555|nr:protein MANBAL [Phasianus colchicus]
MMAEMDFSSPEIAEFTVMENVLHYELFFEAIFQLTCVSAIIISISKSFESRTDSFEPQTSETVKKPKAIASQISKKLKKESRKK